MEEIPELAALEPSDKNIRIDSQLYQNRTIISAHFILHQFAYNLQCMI